MHLWRSFAAACRAGSLSGAARALSSTQPTVSRQIAQLEAQIGHTLFSRSRSGLIPTEHARSLMTLAASMIDQAETLERLARSGSSTETTALTLTASQITGTAILPPLLSAFYNSHPALRLTLSLSETTENVLEREADIAIRHTAPMQQELWGRRIGTVPIKLFAHREYLEKHGPPSSLADLPRHRLIASTAHLRDIPELAALGLTPAFSCRDDIGLLAALRAGVGIGYSQAPLASGYPELLPVLPDYVPATLPFWVVTHRDLRNVPSIRTLMQFLAEALGAYCRQAGS
ncbi:LysR family transcriptional regulator [Asaia astilbis]